MANREANRDAEFSARGLKVQELKIQKDIEQQCQNEILKRIRASNLTDAGSTVQNELSEPQQ